MQFKELYSTFYTLSLVPLVGLHFYAWNSLKKENQNIRWTRATNWTFYTAVITLGWYLGLGFMTQFNYVKMPIPPVFFQFTHFSVYVNILNAYLAYAADDAIGGGSTVSNYGLNTDRWVQIASGFGIWVNLYGC